MNFLIFYFGSSIWTGTVLLQIHTHVTIKVPAGLLRRYSTDAYISYQNSLPKAYHRPDHSIHIVKYHKKRLLSLNPETLVFTA